MFSARERGVPSPQPATQQGPLAHFDLPPEESDGTPNAAQGTVALTIVDGIPCPSGADAGRRDMNSNLDVPDDENDRGCNRMFSILTPYGLKDGSDGSSNTVAFSEALAGDGRIGGGSSPSRSRDDVVRPASGEVADPRLYDAASLQPCSTSFVPGNIADDRGGRWIDGTTGFTTCMADGCVRFVEDSVNRTTWRDLGSRDGGEVVSSDSS